MISPGGIRDFVSLSIQSRVMRGVPRRRKEFARPKNGTNEDAKSAANMRAAFRSFTRRCAKFAEAYPRDIRRIGPLASRRRHIFVAAQRKPVLMQLERGPQPTRM